MSVDRLARQLCVVLAGIAVIAPAVLSSPHAQIAIGVLVFLGFALGTVFLFLKAVVSGERKPHRKPRYGVAERVARGEPVPLDQVLGARGGGRGAGGSRRGSQGRDSHAPDDDLGIFSRRRP